MKNLIRLEELALAVLSGWMLSDLEFGIDWWGYILLFLLPDAGMLGYAIDSRVGAVTYNLCHLRLVAICLLIAGFTTGGSWWLFAGWMLLLHISVDRIFGYGLKYFTGFKFTHLGRLK